MQCKVSSTRKFHGKQFAIDLNVAMSLPMHISNAGGIVVNVLCSSDHLK